MTDIEALVQELIDERDIRRVLIAIARTVDEKDFDQTAQLYAEDGELVTPWGGHRGRTGLADHIRGDLDIFPGLHHVSAGHEIEVATDRATARARMTLLSTHVLNVEGTAFTMLGGYYSIDLVREGEQWKLQRVQIHPAWRFETEAEGAGTADARLI